MIEYLKPEVDIFPLECEDVIATSPEIEDGLNGNTSSDVSDITSSLF